MCQSELDGFVHCDLAVRRWAWGGTELEASARLHTERKLEVWASGRLASSLPQLRDLRAAAPLFFPWIVAIVAYTLLIISTFTFVVVVLVVGQTRPHMNVKAV